MSRGEKWSWAIRSLLRGGGVLSALGFSVFSCAAGRGADAVSSGAVIASDDFRHGLASWRVELQDAGSRVSARDGVLDVWATAGVTLWFREALAGDYEICFTATPEKASFPRFPDRVSDLNFFWNATTQGGDDPASLKADGSLNAYDALRLYYVGFGANGNKTTRLRRYDGSPARPQISGYADAAELTPADTLGPLPAFARLEAGRPVRVRVQSINAADGEANVRVLANDRPVFSWRDPEPYRQGWFGFRTTISHFRLSDFRVVRL